MTYTVHTTYDFDDKESVELEAEVHVGAFMAGDAPDVDFQSLVRLDTEEDVFHLLNADRYLAEDLAKDAVKAYEEDDGYDG